MQRVDALVDLRLDDPRIDRDAKILEIVRASARDLIKHPIHRTRGGKHPSLYTRYRGTAFPIPSPQGLRIPLWRDLTPWMKVQLATLALSDRGYMQFKLHVHDDLMASWEAAGRDPRVELRDSIARHLKRRFPVRPWFFFVMEDLTKRGDPTRPHAHGSIEVPPLPIPTRGLGSRRLAAMAREVGVGKAEVARGWDVVVEALKVAAGGAGPRFAETTGVDQCRNLWPRPPYHALFNSQWVDYAFKHTKTVRTTLGQNRLVLPYDLRDEARRLWTLLTKGEPAMSAWD